MANVKAGVAYVDVRLGDVSKLKAELLASFAQMGKEIANQLGDNIKKNAPVKQATEVGDTLGKVTSTQMSKAFFADAKGSFGAGFRALATGELRTAGSLFRSAGTAMSLGLRTGFESGLRGVGNIFRSTFSALPALASRIGSTAGRAFSTMGSAVVKTGQQVDTFSKKMGFLAFQLQNLGFVATAAFTAPVVAIFGFGAAIGITVASQIEQATAALKFLLPKGYDLEALLKRLQKVAQDSPIFDTADLIQFTQTFVAAGVEVGRTERFLKAFSNVALVTGTSTERAELAIRAITQAFGKGKLQAEELTQQLAEAMPAAMKIIRESLGVTQKELVKMVSEGKISGNDLIDIFTKIGESKQFLEGAAAGANTLAGKWQELKESVSTQLGEIFLENADTIKKAIDKIGPLMSGLIKDSKPLFEDMINGFVGLIEKIKELISWYKNLSPDQKELLGDIAQIAIVAGPAIIALGTLGMAIGGIAAGVAALLNPVGLVIGIVLLAAGAFLYFWNTSEKFREALIAIKDAIFKNVVEPMKGPLMGTWEDIKKAWNDLVSQFTDGSDQAAGKLEFLKTSLIAAGLTLGLIVGVVIGVIKGIIGAIGPLVAAVLSFVGGIIKILSGLINFITGVFTGDWKQAWEGIKEIWDGLWDAIIGTLFNIGKAIVKFVGGLVTGIVDFFKWVYNILVGNSIIPDMVNAIIGWFKKLVDKGVSIVTGLGNFFRAFYGKYIAPFVNAIATGARNVITKFSEMVTKVKSTLSGVGTWLYNTGRDLIQGLLNGILSMAKSVASTAADVVGKAISAAKSKLGVGSPSKVFMEIGKNTMEGFVIGVDKKADDAKKSMRFNLDKIIPTVQPDYGDRGQPPFEPNSPGGPALAIENYYAKDDDPYRQAEDWYFLVQSRGATA